MVKENVDINAQIKLLDDPDKTIYGIVKDNLLIHGKNIIPELEKAWESSLDTLVQDRIETIIQNIQIKTLKEELQEWVNSENRDLIEGAYIIAKYQYPELILRDIKLKIETITNDIWIELNDNLTAIEKIKIINHIIYNVYNYSSDLKDFYSAKHCFINNLFETKKGNPASILLLYAGIAQILNLPVYHVNLPLNFILAFKDELSFDNAFSENNDTSVLFYINPHEKGQIFSRKEIDIYLKTNNIKPDISYYLPNDNIYIIESLIKHLITIYSKSELNDKIEELNELLLIVEEGKPII